MVARAGGYSGHSFKGYQGVNHGNPLSPTISNVVVDDFICHWVTAVTPIEAGTGGIGLIIIDLVVYFCAKVGLVALTQPERLQRAFDVLTSLFYCVGLRSNTGKTTSMVYQPCYAQGGMLEEYYKIHMTGIGPTFWEQQRRKVECL